MEKGDDGGHTRLHRGDVEAPVLLVLDEGFEVGTLELGNVSFARRSIKLEKEHDRGEGAFHGLRLVVRSPLVAHVALEMLLGGKVQRGELLEDAVDRGSVARDPIAAD